LNIENREAEQAIIDSIAIANIVVGNREFHLPVNIELAKMLALFTPNEKVVSTKMSVFMKWYLTNRKVPCSIEIGELVVPFQLPADLYFSLEMEPSTSFPLAILKDEFGVILRSLIPSSMRPPTDKQLWFAKKIALTLGINFKEVNVKTVDACDEFIASNIIAFRQNEDRSKEIAKEAKLACRGYIASTLLGRSLSENEVMVMMDVHNPDTLTKYLKGYSSFVKLYEKLSTTIKDINLHYINELMVSTYEHINIPPLTHEMIKETDAEAIFFPDQ
jgi:hypothetical protein